MLVYTEYHQLNKQAINKVILVRAGLSATLTRYEAAAYGL